MRDSCSLKEVYESCFAVVEANLFLDTHPCCEEAMRYLSVASEKYERAKRAYVSKSGPLVITDACDSCYHSWVKGPWPWEGGKC